MYRCLEFLDSIPLISQAVWDFDGTLVDSEPVQAEAYRLILAEEGIVPPNGVFVHFVGQTEIWSKLAREYSLTADLTSLRERRLKTLGKLLEDTPQIGLRYRCSITSTVEAHVALLSVAAQNR